MNIIIGGDHAGFALKQELFEKLRQDGHTVQDVGCYSLEPVDFPDVAKKICAAILNGQAERGVMVCGTGVGAAIACNKTKGIRASVIHDAYTARQCVEHDDVQVCALGAQVIGNLTAFDLLKIFLNARFSGDAEFITRLNKLSEME
ncbi:MAG: RpiB/LacA/LacB family sugar-phosphate isomerase [Clostridiales bacterium]|nr:RpiB/LacA/LacB family sugar-phosphate isomerase [Clostridiales bacterium]